MLVLDKNISSNYLKSLILSIPLKFVTQIFVSVFTLRNRAESYSLFLDEIPDYTRKLLIPS